MTKTIEIQKLLNKLDELEGDSNSLRRFDISSVVENILNEKISKIQDPSHKNVTVKELHTLESQIKELKDSTNLSGISKEISAVGIEHKKLSGILSSKIETLEAELSDYKTKQFATTKKLDKKISDIKIPEIPEYKDNKNEILTEVETKLKSIKKDFIRLVQNIGGGSMNRKITFAGVDYLTRYTDINYINGSNVTYTIANNDAKKRVDVTISSSGGGGGSTRSVNTISTSTNAGASIGTDYVYICNAPLTLTMPDATLAGLTNLYTIKNISNGTIVITPEAGQLIDTRNSMQLSNSFTSVDLVSDGSNWSVT